jgi:thiol-disulfide isomerase/thioredoxin
MSSPGATTPTADGSYPTEGDERSREAELEMKRSAQIGIGVAAVAAAFAVWVIVAWRDSNPEVAGRAAASREGPRAIELFAPYCPACLRMRPVVDEINARCAVSGVSIEGLDVTREENEDLVEAYGVQAIPTFLFLDESGAVASRLVGAQSAERIARALSEAGLGSCAGPTSMNGAARSGEEV